MRLAEAPAETAIPWLENGDRLNAADFLRRYDAMPHLEKAQLIEGVVHMPSPVRAFQHAEPDGLIHGWLFTYALIRPGLKFFPNVTLLLDDINVVQPDAVLCSAPRDGGRVWISEHGYLAGKPELVVEIAATTASVDLHDKRQAYQRNGIQEYLVWLTADRTVHWFHLVDGVYTAQKPTGATLHSQVHPGLVLDVDALLGHDRPRLVAALEPK